MRLPAPVYATNAQLWITSSYDPNTPASLQSAVSPSGTFSFRFRERKDLGDVQRLFERSSDLNTWTSVTRVAVTNFSDLGQSWLRQATFAAPSNGSFFRLHFVR